MYISLLYKGRTEQPYKSQQCPTDRCLPTAKVVCEHADHGWTEEDHAHGQGPNPGYRGRTEETSFKLVKRGNPLYNIVVMT